MGYHSWALLLDKLRGSVALNAGIWNLKCNWRTFASREFTCIYENLSVVGLILLFALENKLLRDL